MAVHLTNECARATLTADRCDNYRQARIEEQTTGARRDWEERRERKVNRLARQVNDRPESAVKQLLTFGHGIRWMIVCFEEMLGEVQSQGFLAPDSLALGIKLLGISPVSARIRQNLDAYTISLYNLGCTPWVSATVIQEWMEPANRPDVLRELPEDQVIGRDAAENRELLVTALEDHVDRLRAEDERISRDVDWPSLASVMKKASILTEDDARRVARSHAEARATFHRASKDLIPALERDKENDLSEPTSGEDEHGDNEAEAEAANEPSVVVEAGAALAASGDPAEGLGPEREVYQSRNEPEKGVDASAQVVDPKESSVDSRPSEPDRQNGVLSGAPALPETPNQPAMVGGVPGPGAARTSTHYSAVGRHHRASERAQSRCATAAKTAPGNDSRNEPENISVTATQNVVVKAHSVTVGLSEPSRQMGFRTPYGPSTSQCFGEPAGLVAQHPPVAGDTKQDS
jgi:hypothetical protein